MFRRRRLFLRCLRVLHQQRLWLLRLQNRRFEWLRLPRLQCLHLQGSILGRSLTSQSPMTLQPSLRLRRGWRQHSTMDKTRMAHWRRPSITDKQILPEASIALVHGSSAHRVQHLRPLHHEGHLQQVRFRRRSPPKSISSRLFCLSENLNTTSRSICLRPLLADLRNLMETGRRVRSRTPLSGMVALPRRR